MANWREPIGKYLSTLGANTRNQPYPLTQLASTYPVEAILGCSSGHTPDSGSTQSPDRFVGFPSIRQKHRNYGAQLAKMAPCKFSGHRSKIKRKVNENTTLQIVHQLT